MCCFLFINIFPEFIAILTFLPSGVFMGFMLYMYNVLPDGYEHDEIKYWPYVVTIVSAAITAFTLFGLKKKYQKEIFAQFYFLYVAIPFFALSGYFLLVSNGTVAVYLLSVAHGICYIAGLSYLSVKVSVRRSTIALAHLFYLIGMALTSQSITFSYDEDQRKFDIDEIYFRFGLDVSVKTAVILVLMVINEILNLTNYKSYRRSTDQDFNDENANGTLLMTRAELIVNTSRIHRAGFELYVYNEKNRNSYYWLVWMKLKDAIVFSAPLMLFARIRSGDHAEYTNEYILVGWLMVAGAFVGFLLIRYFNMKFVFIGMGVGQICCLVAFLVIHEDYIQSKYSMFFYYTFSAIALPIADRSILDMTPIKFTEIFVFLGYVLEIIIIALAQNTLYIITFPSLLTFLLGHTIPTIVVIFVLMLIIYFNLPIEHQKSILQIRNSLYGINYKHHSYCDPNIAPSVIAFPSANISNAYSQHKKMYQLPPATNSQDMQPGSSKTSNKPPPLQNFNGIGVGFGPSQYSNDFRMMSPGYIMPRAIIGGAIFTSLTLNNL